MRALSLLLGVERPQLGPALLPALVVFLVALPLSLGVALASGVPPAAGLWSAIIGGLVVGRLAGSPLQVTGPAAGLAVLVFEIVQTHGLAGLGVVVFLSGVLQLGAGILSAGRLFRAVSPAVVRGMLAGIGLLIFASQLHVVLGSAPTGSGLDDWLTLPSAFASLSWAPALVGGLAIAGIVGWDNLRPARLRSVPGALVGVGAAIAVAAVAGLPVPTVTLPESLVGAIDWLTPAELAASVGSSAVWLSAATLAAVASAEAMLSSTAVDRLHDGVRTDYDRELRAQGVGNLVAGVFGALPVTGVIVRSSANVAAGATDRLPGMIHAALILGLVLLAPALLQAIPLAALAAVLVVTGVRLLDVKGVIALAKQDRIEAALLITTAGTIVAVDLLTGIAVGVGLSMLRVALQAAKLELDMVIHHERREVVVTLAGAATFLAVPDLVDTLEQVPEGYAVQIDHRGLQHVDHAIVDTLSTWSSKRGPDALDGGLDALRARVQGAA
jgi:MFS superfamily sulfate permease-like transporter